MEKRLWFISRNKHDGTKTVPLTIDEQYAKLCFVPTPTEQMLDAATVDAPLVTNAGSLIWWDNEVAK
jgi:hypothetical protein